MFVLGLETAVLWITISLIPYVVLFWIALGIAALALPIVGTIKASQGDYCRYPVVGLQPG